MYRTAVSCCSPHTAYRRKSAAAAESRLQTMDATCPLVAKVHTEAARLARAGYTIILIGHAGHDEVVGTVGEAPQNILLVESVEQAESLQVAETENIAYLTQTTLSLDDARRIVAVLHRRFPQIRGPRTQDICYATQNRQDAVREVATAADVVLVLGSKNSSNSIRLVEVSQECGTPAYLIDEVSAFRRDLAVRQYHGGSYGRRECSGTLGLRMHRLAPGTVWG